MCTVCVRWLHINLCTLKTYGLSNMPRLQIAQLNCRLRSRKISKASDWLCDFPDRCCRVNTTLYCILTITSLLCLGRYTSNPRSFTIQLKDNLLVINHSVISFFVPVPWFVKSVTFCLCKSIVVSSANNLGVYCLLCDVCHLCKVKIKVTQHKALWHTIRYWFYGGALTLHAEELVPLC